MNMVGSVIAFIEVLSVLLIYNILINGNLFKRLGISVILATITFIIYILSNQMYGIDPLIRLIGILFINAIVISKIEKKDTIVAFIEFIISFIVVAIFELISSALIHIIIGEKDPNPITLCIFISAIMFGLISMLSLSKGIKKLKFSQFISKYKIINTIILNLLVFFLLIKSLMLSGMLNSKVIIHITILGIILIGINCYFYMHLYTTLNEKKKKEIKKSFNPLINDLMTKLKANEHEYKNHLNTIWSIVQISEPEEIKEKLKDYISTVVDDTEEFAMLLNVENTIIKAVLYNKGQRAEKLGISYKYNIKSNLKDISLDNSELTVILSNLLNNAIEATSMIEEKKFEVNIEEDNKYYIINTKNKSNALKAENLNDIFKIGYTTKGEGRGYGLYNVKNIVDRYRGKIQISLEDDIVNIKLLFNK